MEKGHIRCVRCQGRKKLFKINSGYSYTNTGGIEVKCPLCLGEGWTKPLEIAIEEAKQANHKHDKSKERSSKDAEKNTESRDNYEQA